jgi:uncharacterized protein YegP (UPF0339 family)
MVFHIYRDVRNEWRWYLRAPNGTRLANSGEGYVRKNDCVLAIQHLKSTLRADEGALVYDNISPLASLASSGLIAASFSR